MRTANPSFRFQPYFWTFWGVDLLLPRSPIYHRSRRCSAYKRRRRVARIFYYAS